MKPQAGWWVGIFFFFKTVASLWGGGAKSQGGGGAEQPLSGRTQVGASEEQVQAMESPPSKSCTTTESRSVSTSTSPTTPPRPSRRSESLVGGGVGMGLGKDVPAYKGLVPPCQPRPYPVWGSYQAGKNLVCLRMVPGP